jgi:beta-glucosidase
VKSKLALFRAARNLVKAHAAARRAVTSAIPGAQIGIAHNVLRFFPARTNHPGDRLSAWLAAQLYNHAFIRAAREKLDFIGVNYYSRLFVKRWHPFYEDRSGSGFTDMGWEIHPEGLTEALLDMARYRLPLYVTENGIDDRDDSRRAAYLHDHLGAVLTAIDRGADVRGYLHWSLIDNFEWLEAFGPRFGLFGVDYATYARTATKAVELYKRIIAERALPEDRPPARIKKGEGRKNPIF